MADSFIRRQREKNAGFSATQCLRIFGVSHSGYYAWLERREDRNGKLAARDKEQGELKEKFREIVKKLGFVPGKRSFQTYLWRDYGVSISVKRCHRIMKEMNLEANRPKKDAYKHQATHNHEYASPENSVIHRTEKNRIDRYHISVLRRCAHADLSLRV